METSVDVAIPIESEAALAEPRNRGAVGLLISRVLRPHSGPSALARAIAAIRGRRRSPTPSTERLGNRGAQQQHECSFPIFPRMRFAMAIWVSRPFEHLRRPRQRCPCSRCIVPKHQHDSDPEKQTGNYTIECL
jgi:hypothetical protein